MLKHNLKLILRSLWKKRIYSSIILLSLTAGFVCTNMLVSFLVYETNTDSFHTKRERIFQLFSDDPFGGSRKIAFIPNEFTTYLTDNYSEVEKACQISGLEGVSIQQSSVMHSDFTLLAVDSSFFFLFDFPLLQGRPDKSLASDKIILSREKALALFGHTDVVGNLLSASTSDTTKVLIVSAVLDKPSENSHLHFDALVHHSVFPNQSNGGGVTYGLLTTANAREPLMKKINSDTQRPGLLGEGKTKYFFHPLTDSYFNTDNRMVYMKTRSPLFLTVGYVVCGLILFIATFNFINLLLLSWQNRRKETGIKKTLGVTWKGLMEFSIAEAAVYVFTGFLFSMAITFFTIPVFNSVFESNLSLEYFSNTKVIGSLSALLFLTTCLAVVLSASKQWSMRAINLIRRDVSGVRFSRLLFTAQFIISITLTICSVTIIQQMDHLEQAPLGFNRYIVQVDAPDERLANDLGALKQKVIQIPDVNNVTVTNGNPISGNAIVRYDLADEQFYTPYLFGGDEDYFRTLGLQLTDGQMPSEVIKGKLVNKTLVRLFNMDNPVGQKVPGTANDVIVGVVEDFTCGSFKQEIPPAIISFQKDGRSLLVDYQGADVTNVVPKIQLAWKSVYPDHAFSYRVIQDELMKKYKEDTFFFKIVVTFSVVSMILACFGLFALSWAVVQSRIKEMGIRKVLGATPVDIMNLLTLTFTKRIVAAFLIAAPLGYWLMNEWLSRFVNKIELSAWIFCIAGFLVIVVALLTLSVQTFRAAMTSPVQELQNE